VEELDALQQANLRAACEARAKRFDTPIFIENMRRFLQ
jgi:hypothetical protein